tara:strand:- start:22083 stop:25133 length:3051 start_codon:yes stop_codon:yes gene_type:complete
MAVEKFKFLSPGVFIAEVDESIRDTPRPEDGPIIIGRTEHGPAMRPVSVDNWSDWTTFFGNPIDGTGKPASEVLKSRTGGKADVYRLGNYQGPTYAGYAAESYLKSGASPATTVRLLGMGPSGASTDAAKAGWYTETTGGAAAYPNTVESANGGAWGLFVFQSASVGPQRGGAGGSGVGYNMSGTLAAIFYLSEGNVRVSGSILANEDYGTTLTSSAYTLISSLNTTLGGAGATSNTFALEFRDQSGTVYKKAVVDFTKGSTNYIRNVLNVDPVATNANLVGSSNQQKYFLGETYEEAVARIVGAAGAGAQYGAIMCLQSGSALATAEGHHRMLSDYQYAKTGYIFSQDLSADRATFDPANGERAERLFRFCATDAGEYIQKNIKISISNITDASYEGGYPTFDVEVRTIGSRDSKLATEGRLEYFQRCNLDRNSNKFIGRVIGDYYYEYDKANERLVRYGEFPNRSRYIRVEMYSDATPINKGAVPFGFEGPLKPRDFATISGSNQMFAYDLAAKDTLVQASEQVNTMVQFRTKFSWLSSDQESLLRAKEFASATGVDYTASIQFPSTRLRSTNSDAGDSTTKTKGAYFGFSALKVGSDQLDPGVVDYLRPLPFGLQSDSFTPGDASEISYYFTLDDIVGTADSATYTSGSRKAGTSRSAVGSEGWKSTVGIGAKNFSLPLYGGFDGLRINEKEPFNNSDLAGTTKASYYANYSLRTALKTVEDAEVTEANILTIPGITETTITDEVIRTAEERQDVLAIIDVEGGYVPATENSNSKVTRTPKSVATAVSNIKSRQLDSSFAACYYPWVYITDTRTAATVYLPPSVVGLGAMGRSDASTDQVWFAPAGFNRGGISKNQINLQVGGVTQQLNRDDRDELYEVDINPIANFTQEGIVVFGQKTLLADPSALDRINVRRMLIYVKKKVRLIANGILFDQNVEDTWNRFRNQTEDFLRGVQTNLGISEYLVKLDNTTTTADLIDQNVLYAKVYIKPARAIEFIALDFVITRTDADFSTY